MLTVKNRLSDEQLTQYDRDGFVFPVDVFSASELAQFRAGFESILNSSGESSPKRFNSLHLFFDWAYRLVSHPAVLDAVESILGPDILVYGTLVFHKPPNDLSYASWHQDSFYSGLHLTPSSSAWIALTPSNQTNGCMRMIPGTHKLGALDHDTVTDDPNLLNRRGERVKMVVDESEAVDVVLRPGQMSLHQSTIVHGSNANESDEKRVGFIVRYVTSQMADSKSPMLRVRGDADCGHLVLAQPPMKSDEKHALAAWRVAGTKPAN